MQELVLIRSGPILESDVAGEAENSGLHRDFEALLAECGGLAFRVAQSVLHNPADAEDVAQEAFFRAYRNFDQLRNATHFRSWLVRIAFRLALDRRRSGKRRERRETEWALPDNNPKPATAEEIAVSNQFQARLEKAIEELPEKFRLVVILAAIQGYTLEEIAGMLDVPIGTVKSRLFLARKRLAEKLR